MAMMMASLLEISVQVNNVDGNPTRTYNLLVYPAGSVITGDEQVLSLESIDGTASYNTSTFLDSGGEIFLTQVPLSGWRLSTINCTSSDPEFVSQIIPDGIKIVGHPFNQVTCNFTNLKDKNPVVIIPGVLSSNLNIKDDQQTELWPNLPKILFGLPGDRYLDELSLNQAGLPNIHNPPVFPTDILRKIGKNDFFAGLIEQLITHGYEENKNLFVFPYDWRLDIGSNKLKEKIDQILEQTGSEKVNIIAHSLGGLLAKYYIKHNENNRVDKFIDIATPHLGAPSAFKTLTFGDDLGIKFGIFGLNSDEVKKIVQNMPSIYQLLPSLNYFSTSSPNYKYYLYDMDDVDKNGIRARLDFVQTKQFMKNTGRNELLLDTAPNIHYDLDYMNPADYGVTAYNIVGCGVPTIGKIFTLGQKNSAGKYYDVAYINGDGTVPEKSARSFPVSFEYQISGVKHSVLPSNLRVSSLIADLVENIDSDTATSSTDCKLPNGSLLSFHGQVQVDIYDQNNNHAGPVLGLGYEQAIPDIFYDYIEENTFVYLPAVKEYQVKVRSKKNGRSSIHIKKFEEEQVISTTYYDDIPLITASSTLKVNINNSEPEIILDSRGDNTEIRNILPSATSTGDSLADLIPPTTIVNITPFATSTTVSFESTDTDILETEYSLDGGETYNEATSTFIVSEIGTTTIIYQSTDTAGNIENPQQVDVYISPTLPTAVSATTATSSTVVSEPESISTSTPSAISTITNAIEVVGRNRGVDKNKVSKRELISTTTTALTFVPIVEPEVVTIPVEIVTPLKASTAGKILPTESKINDLYYASAIGVGPKAKGYIWWILFIIIILIFLIKICLKRK